MKRKWIFLFTLSLLALSRISNASYAYYESADESEDSEEVITSDVNDNGYDFENNNYNNGEANNPDETYAQRLLEEQQKLQELSSNIDVKIPLEQELEASLDNETDSTEVSQSAILRKPAIKEKDQEENTESLFPEESDEVSLSNSGIQKPQIENTETQYRQRRNRSR